MGLVCGDPDDKVGSVVVAVDPVADTVDEALTGGAQLLLTHHPLLLRGVHGVGADTPKGALVHRLVRGGAALFTAHTNADAADPGVSDALAEALGLTVEGPLEPHRPGRWTRSSPSSPSGRRSPPCTRRWPPRGPGPWATTPIARSRRRGPASSGRSPARTRRSARSGSWSGWPRPGWRWCSRAPAGPASSPPCVPRIRTRIPRSTCSSWPTCRRRAGSAGSGRWRSPSRWPPSPTASPRRCRRPHGGCGLRAIPGGRCSRVAVCGGSGDSALGAATAAAVDAYVTADLRHHPASEHLLADRADRPAPALVDVAHWASEWPWCTQAADVLRAELGGNVEVRVSTRRTDPWTIGRTQE